MLRRAFLQLTIIHDGLDGTPERSTRRAMLMGSVRELSIGAGAAWRAPRVIASGLAALVAHAPSTSAPVTTSAPPLAARASHLGIACLARLAPNRWRNTCLYRSVAECVALRAIGRPARIVIGVGTGGTRDEVIAHAWVECDGTRALSTRGQAELETLSAGARRAS